MPAKCRIMFRNICGSQINHIRVISNACPDCVTRPRPRSSFHTEPPLRLSAAPSRTCAMGVAGPLAEQTEEGIHIQVRSLLTLQLIGDVQKGEAHPAHAESPARPCGPEPAQGAPPPGPCRGGNARQRPGAGNNKKTRPAPQTAGSPVTATLS